MSTVAVKKPKAFIKARVFRAKQQKPLLIPGALWRFAQARKWPGTGRWENLGTIASTDMGNAHITQK